MMIVRGNCNLFDWKRETTTRERTQIQIARTEVHYEKCDKHKSIYHKTWCKSTADNDGSLQLATAEASRTNNRDDDDDDDDDIDDIEQ